MRVSACATDTIGKPMSNRTTGHAERFPDECTLDQKSERGQAARSIRFTALKCECARKRRRLWRCRCWRRHFGHVPVP